VLEFASSPLIRLHQSISHYT